ncbi:MAG: hypothetical protein PHF31_02135 [Methylobacter sp.]|nr:hypothetical protein [Methylobacter sp.]
MKIEIKWEGSNKFLIGHESEGGPVSVSFGIKNPDNNISDLNLTKTGLTSQTVEIQTLTKPLQLKFRVNLKVSGYKEESLFLVQNFEFIERKLVPTSYIRHRYQYSLFNSGTIKVFPYTNTQLVIGQHPLLNTIQNRGGWKISIDTEFIDATELWWKVHYRSDPNEFFPWILDPRLTKRIKQLRVLLWTSGDPMIWFVSASDLAVSGGDQVQAVVFYRPPGSSPYDYSIDEQGFALPRHRTTGMYVLARYLSNPLPSTFSGTPPHNSWSVMFEFERGGKNADPSVNIDSARLIGLEDAINNAGHPIVLFLPWVNGGKLGDGAVGQNLFNKIQSAFRILWDANILGKDLPVFVKTSQAIWLAGYSRGGLSLWDALEVNRSSVDRIITIDANKLTTTGKDALLKSAKEAKEKRRKLSIRLISTPYQGVITENFLTQFKSIGADAVALPDPQRKDFWDPPNNEVFLAFTAKWTQEEVKLSWKTNEEKWKGLFHQFAAFGGENLISLPNGGKRVQTFFEESLLIKK